MLARSKQYSLGPARLAPGVLVGTVSSNIFGTPFDLSRVGAPQGQGSSAKKTKRQKLEIAIRRNSKKKKIDLANFFHAERTPFWGMVRGVTVNDPAGSQRRYCGKRSPPNRLQNTSPSAGSAKQNTT
jgi:hypothetical protein